MTDDELDVERLRLLAEPRAWLEQANRLDRAADLVGSQFQGEANTWFLSQDWSDESEEAQAMRRAAYGLGQPAYMLIGYAIEVLLKGLIAVRAGTRENLEWMSRQHIGMELFNRAGVELSQPEEGLVTRQLYHAVWWAGRYHVPSRRDATLYVEQIRAAGGSIFTDPRAMSTDHYRQASELYARLEAELRAEIEAAGLTLT